MLGCDTRPAMSASATGPLESSRDLASQLLSLLDNAPSVAHFRSQIRVDKREVYRLVDAIRRALERESGPDSHRFNLLIAAEHVREPVYNAYPVPLTDQVRLHKAKAAELASAVRTAATL
jgi:hypothetical protein